MNQQALDISDHGQPVPRYPEMEREIHAGHTRFLLLPPGEVIAHLDTKVCFIDVNLNPVNAQWSWNSDQLRRSLCMANSLAFIPPKGEFHVKVTNVMPGLILELEPNYWSEVLKQEFDLSLQTLDFLNYAQDPISAELGRAGISLLMEDFRSGERTDSLTLEAIGLALIARIARRFQDDRRMTAVTLPANALTPERLARIKDYIEANLGGGISLATLANIACLSSSHFSRTFKLATGASPLRYVIGRRVERAKLLLPQRELSIAQVAFDCGFSSQSHLTRTFHDLTGITPAVFKKQAQPRRTVNTV
nr:AraC family transcriptional regulator [uncultured Halomonas sp.]